MPMSFNRECHRPPRTPPLAHTQQLSGKLIEDLLKNIKSRTFQTRHRGHIGRSLSISNPGSLKTMYMLKQGRFLTFAVPSPEKAIFFVLECRARGPSVIFTANYENDPGSQTIGIVTARLDACDINLHRIHNALAVSPSLPNANVEIKILRSV